MHAYVRACVPECVGGGGGQHIAKWLGHWPYN